MKQSKTIAAPEDGSADPSNRAFHRLHDQYEHAVAGFFARRGFAAEEVRDLTQETFLRVFKYIEDLRNEAAEKRWLFTVATNVYRNELRRRGTEKRSAIVGSLDAAIEGGHQVERTVLEPSPSRQEALDDLLAAERRRLLLQALDELPPRMRQCTLMRLGQGRKYREIAAALRISPETVKVQLHQARKRLALRLGDRFTELEAVTALRSTESGGES